MSTENEAAIKVIVELQAKPGKRAELRVGSFLTWRDWSNLEDWTNLETQKLFTNDPLGI
jgi:hypothetical protein